MFNRLGKGLLTAALALMMTVVVVAATGQSSNQMLSETDLVDNVNAGNLKWSGSAITGTTKMVTHSEFTADIANNGSCPGSSTELMSYSEMTSCRVLASVHTPILTNASFQSTCASWTLAGTSGTGLFAETPACSNTTDEDADNFFAAWTTATGSSCGANTSTTCKGTVAQTVSISGTPTSQSVSFYYKGFVNTAVGDSTNCNPITGTASVTLKINSTTYSPTLTLDNAWHQYSTTTTALVNGSNTVTFTMSGQTTVNQAFNNTTQLCQGVTYTNNNINVDNAVLTASW